MREGKIENTNVYESKASKTIREINAVAAKYNVEKEKISAIIKLCETCLIGVKHRVNIKNWGASNRKTTKVSTKEITISTCHNTFYGNANGNRNKASKLEN